MTPGNRPEIAAAMLLLVAAAPAAVSADSPESPVRSTQRSVINGSFEGGTFAPWWLSGATGEVTGGRLCVSVPGGTANRWDAIVGQNAVALKRGASYRFQFQVAANQPATIRATVQMGVSPYTAVLAQEVQIGTEAKSFAFDFVSDLEEPAGQITFQLGGHAQALAVCLDDISVEADSGEPGANGRERIVNGVFDSGSADPWWGGANTRLSVDDGALCVAVAGGTANPWDALIGQSAILLEQGQSYSLQFDAWADRAVAIRTTVQLGASPYTATLAQAPQLGLALQSYRFDFTSSLATDAGQVTFQLGGGAENVRVCFDNVSLVGGTSSGGYHPDTGPAVRVNQLGFVPHGPKRATFVTDAVEPQPWQLRSSDGAVVASGKTERFGADAASGDAVHLIDFSSFTRPGASYRLKVADVESHPFDISASLYRELRTAALEFFYHQRSGTPIDASLVGEAYARPAGHLGMAPNLGDTSVTCFAGACDYSIDARGGWYDAGDHGKYVVNGGISLWQLMNTYERATRRDKVALRDGTQAIPESANGVPDILDEARWEMEFLLRVQVPDGRPNAGMAFHRLHDESWTGFPTRPDLDAQPRHLYPPSTAATLNLAAVAAQSARIWERYDRAFAARCLAAAERAWSAARANPAVAAPPSLAGGGEYGDAKVSDEFYWAAAELFATTGRTEYRDFVVAAPEYQGKAIPEDGYGWSEVSALGDLTLAYAPTRLARSEKSGLRKAIAAAADKAIAKMQRQGYANPYLPADGKYVWGSNSQALNQMTLIGAAFDLTSEPKYRRAAFEAMDYILGRNALNLSYVTGFGAKTSQNQHHRFWCHQSDPTYPHPPAGALAGGPNSFLQDPVMASKLQSCAAAKCYIDDIAAYSVNEVAINWNSALVWVSAWLSDRAY